MLRNTLCCGFIQPFFLRYSYIKKERFHVAFDAYIHVLDSFYFISKSRKERLSYFFFIILRSNISAYPRLLYGSCLAFCLVMENIQDITIDTPPPIETMDLQEDPRKLWALHPSDARKALIGPEHIKGI